MSAPANVTRGMKFLDERLPGWRDRVNRDTLDLSNCSQCILGQVLGDYDVGVELLGLSPREAARYGFWSFGRQTFRSLTEAWRKALS